MSKLFRYSLFLFILLGLPFMVLPVLTHALALPVPAVISTVFTVLYLGILIAVVRKTRLGHTRAGHPRCWRCCGVRAPATHWCR